MDKNEFEKLNRDYAVNDETLLFGITPRLGAHIVERLKDLNVLETCGGAGFITIELAKIAAKVFSVDINSQFQEQSKHNVKLAGLEDKVTYFHGDVLSHDIINKLPKFDAAILDPAWNNGVLSEMSPPGDLLFKTIHQKTKNIVFVLPPFTSKDILNQIPAHELEKLYLDDELALLCLYFGNLAQQERSVFRA